MVTDSAGGMAKSALDLALLFDIIVSDKGCPYSSPEVMTKDWNGQRIGFVNSSLWRLSPAVCDADEELLVQQNNELEQAIQKLNIGGAHVVRDVRLPSMNDLVLDGEDALEQLWGMSPLLHYAYLS